MGPELDRSPAAGVPQTGDLRDGGTRPPKPHDDDCRPSEMGGAELHRAVRTLAFAGRGLERAAAPLTLPQYRVLTLIATAPERASRLADRVDVTRAAMTGVLDALEARGWVRRTEVVGDRRGVALEVTPTGGEVLTSAEDAMATWLQEVLIDGTLRSRAVLAGVIGLGEALAEHHLPRLAPVPR